MYGTKIRDKEYTARLLEFIKHEYGLLIKDISSTKRGYYGETWKADKYFLKLDYSYHKETYRRSIPIIFHLCSFGVDNIGTPIKTLNNKLYADFDGAVLGIFNFIEGVNIQNDETRKAEFQILSKVYSVSTKGLDIARQDFTAESADLFFEQWSKLDDTPLKHLFYEYKSILEHRRTRLELLAQYCSKSNDNFFITHGDAGGNMIQSHDKFYLIDWDGAALAPPERDAWFYMHMDGEIEKFSNALKNSEIDYTIRPERLAYFCYRTFFQYLVEYMRTFFELGSDGVKAESIMQDFFKGWLNPIMELADNFKL